MKCPSCGKDAKYNKTYNMHLCINPSCDLYLTDDISKSSHSPRAINSNYQKRIKETINEFDFDKVRNVMKFLDWRWAGKRQPPSTTELIQTAEEKLTRLCKEIIQNHHNEFKICSGGFSAYGWVNDHGDIELKLTFSVEESSTYF